VQENINLTTRKIAEPHLNAVELSCKQNKSSINKKVGKQPGAKRKIDV